MKAKQPNPNCPSPIGPCICEPRPKPTPTFMCSICGCETKHDGYTAVRERIVRDHTDLRDCVRHLVERVQELEWKR